MSRIALLIFAFVASTVISEAQYVTFQYDHESYQHQQSKPTTKN